MEGNLNYAHLFPRVSRQREGVALQRVLLWRLGCITVPRLTRTRIQDQKHISPQKLICPLRFVNNFFSILSMQFIYGLKFMMSTKHFKH